MASWGARRRRGSPPFPGRYPPASAVSGRQARQVGAGSLMPGRGAHPPASMRACSRARSGSVGRRPDHLEAGARQSVGADRPRQPLAHQAAVSAGHRPGGLAGRGAHVSADHRLTDRPAEGDRPHRRVHRFGAASAQQSGRPVARVRQRHGPAARPSHAGPGPPTDGSQPPGAPARRRLRPAGRGAAAPRHRGAGRYQHPSAHRGSDQPAIPAPRRVSGAVCSGFPMAAPCCAPQRCTRAPPL